MTYTAASALTLPDAGDAPRFLAFMRGDTDPVLDLGFPTPAALAGGFQFHLLAGLESFWDEEGVGSLTRRTEGLLRSLLLLRHEVVIVAGRDRDCAFITMGTTRSAEGAGVLGKMIETAWPGAAVISIEPGSRHAVDLTNRIGSSSMRVALVGVPTAPDAPAIAPALERLATLAGGWTLSLRARPVDRGELAAWHQAASVAGGELASQIERQVEMTGTVRGTERDGVAGVAFDLADAERARALEATRTGAFMVEAWIEANSPSVLATAASLVMQSVEPAEGQARPLRVVLGVAGGQAPGTVLLPSELAVFVQPPAHDVPGVIVRRFARFDVNPEPVPVPGPSLQLGRTLDGRAVPYPVNAMTRHGLIVGMTGAGKTSVLLHLRSQLPAGVSFLAIEPTKDELANDALNGGVLAGAAVWRVGDPGETRTFNLLEPPPGTPVGTHVDFLATVLRGLFNDEGPLENLWRPALFRAYRTRGWDVVTDTNPWLKDNPNWPAWPSLTDLQRSALVEASSYGYDAQMAQRFAGAIRNRLGSLRSGSKGAVLDTDRPSGFDELLTGDVVVNLDLLGDDNEKALIAIVVLWWVVRRARAGGAGQSLRHLTAIDEAHRLLRRPTASTPATLTDVSERVAAMLAECRAYGEGIVVLDQSVSKLIDDVMVNASLKVALRTEHGPDRNELAATMNLDEAQSAALGTLPVGRAVVSWEGTDRPLLLELGHTFPASSAHGGEPRGGRVLGAVDRHPSRAALSALWAPSLTLLMCASAERPAVSADLRSRVAGILPAGVPEADVDASVNMTVRRAVDGLGHDRRWALSLRDSYADEFEREGITDRPLETALRDRQPLPGCSLACPGGGCTTRELVRARLDRAPVDIRQLPATRDGLAKWARAEGERAVDTTMAPSLARTAARCALVHLLGPAPTDASDDLTVPTPGAARLGLDVLVTLLDHPTISESTLDDDRRDGEEHGDG